MGTGSGHREWDWELGPCPGIEIWTGTGVMGVGDRIGHQPPGPCSGIGNRDCDRDREPGSALGRSTGTTRRERQRILSRLGTAPHGAAARPPSPPGSSGGAGRRRRSRTGKVTGSDAGTGTGTMLRPRAAELVSLMRAAGGGRRYRDPSGGARVPSLCSAPPPQPVIAAKEPFPVELQAGKTYGWCACGHSKRQVGREARENRGGRENRGVQENQGGSRRTGGRENRDPGGSGDSRVGDSAMAPGGLRGIWDWEPPGDSGRSGGSGDGMGWSRWPRGSIRPPPKPSLTPSPFVRSPSVTVPTRRRPRGCPRCASPPPKPAPRCSAAANAPGAPRTATAPTGRTRCRRRRCPPAPERGSAAPTPGAPRSPSRPRHGRNGGGEASNPNEILILERRESSRLQGFASRPQISPWTVGLEGGAGRCESPGVGYLWGLGWGNLWGLGCRGQRDLGRRSLWGLR